MKTRVQKSEKLTILPLAKEKQDTGAPSKISTASESTPLSADKNIAAKDVSAESLQSLRLKRLNSETYTDYLKNYPNASVSEQIRWHNIELSDNIDSYAYVCGGRLNYEPRTIEIDGASFCLEIEPEYFNYCKFFEVGALPDPDLITASDYLDLVYVALYGVNLTYWLVLSFVPNNYPSPKRIFRGAQDRFIIEFENGSTQHIRNNNLVFQDTYAPIRALIERRNDERNAIRNVEGTTTVVAKYPLSIGPLTVNDMNWSTVTFKGDGNIPFGTQKAQILKAMYDLGALGPEKAKSKKEILIKAGLKEDLVLSKPFTARDKNKEIYTAIYNACVGYVDSNGQVIKQSAGKRDGSYFLKIGTTTQS